MVGFGYDVHKLQEGRPLIIGGIDIDSRLGVVAHSDGDVLLHALCDALLGAAGLGDIGEHYPDTDPAYKDADSSIFVKETIKHINKLNFEIVNIDCTIILEKPKLSPYKDQIRINVAEICNIEAGRVNIKAKTNEKLGFTGRQEGISAYCICEIRKVDV